jgi:two-component system NtrC family response regulator
MWHVIVAHIHVMSIRLEPLANRIEDIAPLAESMLEEIRVASSGKVQRFLSSNATSWLQAYPWPNDLRELRQAIQEACMKSPTGAIEPNHFSLAIRTFPSHVLKPDPLPSVNLDRMLEDFERNVLQKALEAFPRNRAAAARHLGISRTRFLRRLAQLGLEASSPEAEAPEASQSVEETIAHDTPIFEEIPDDPAL